jgi:hypothetical protein
LTGRNAFYVAAFAVMITVIIMTWCMRISVWEFMDAVAIFAVVGIGGLINGDIINYPASLS